MKILLVEDEPDLGAAIQRVLRRDGYIVDWVQDGTESWHYLDWHQVEYTVAILDWMVPGITGIEICQRLRSRKDPLPILMLTARDCMEDKVAGLDAGADDYLVKPFGMAELLARIRALQRRSPQIQLPQIQVGNLILDYATRTLLHQTSSQTHPRINLTAKEFQTLEYFIKRPGQILTSEQLMNQLWESGAEPSSNVVAAQIRLLRRKLAEIGQEGLIETIHGMGYRFNLSDASK